VVGVSTTSGGLAHAFLYQSGQIADLGTLGGATSRALAINDSGQIVGVADTALESHAFLYDAGTGTTIDLGTLGGAESALFAINSSGFGAGFAALADGTEYAGYYTYPWLDLGTLGGTSSRAIAINDGGQVAGTSELAGDLDAHAFLWQGGPLIDIAGAGGPSSTAFAINDAGQVVGWTFNPLDWSSHEVPPAPLKAFFYSSDGFLELGTLSGGTSRALDVSNAGLLVGDSDGRAFVSSGAALRDLGTLGGSTSSARAINDRGLIVGAAQTASGVSHAVAWLPVPVAALEVAPASGPAGGTTTLTAVLTLFGLPAPNQSVTFSLNDTEVGSASTDSTGRASLSGVSLAGFSPGIYPGAVRASVEGSLLLAAAESFADLTVAPTPVALDDAYGTDEDMPLNASPGVLENDLFASGGTVALVSGVAHGTLDLRPDGSFDYAPSADYFGTDAFTYLANVSGANSNVATVTITIAPVDDLPVAADDAYVGSSTLLIPAPGVLANDFDADGDVLTAALVSGPADGALTLNSDGSFSYTPSGAFPVDTFQYTALAAGQVSNVATVTIQRPATG
jgi:probable HAF family extracellular repeat protein